MLEAASASPQKKWKNIYRGKLRSDRQTDRRTGIVCGSASKYLNATFSY